MGSGRYVSQASVGLRVVCVLSLLLSGIPGLGCQTKSGGWQLMPLSGFEVPDCLRMLSPPLTPSPQLCANPPLRGKDSSPSTHIVEV